MGSLRRKVLDLEENTTLRETEMAQYRTEIHGLNRDLNDAEIKLVS